MPGSDETLKNDNRWYRLDNAAKIYPAISNSSRGSVYRVAVQMKREVKPDILQEALVLTLPRFPTFGVRMRRGMFWFYFEPNPDKPVVTLEKAPPCRPIILKETNGFLFRVSYYNRRISLEVFHSVADGTGAIAFLKSLVFKYLSLEGCKVIADDSILDGSMCPAVGEVEDSFLKYYDPEEKSSRVEDDAYQIKGTKMASESVQITHGIFPTEDFILLVKKNGATVTEYIAALVIYSVYATQLKGIGHKLPVKVSVPVNLRNFFPSQTLRNFSSYVNIGFTFSNQEYTFEQVLDAVSKQMKNDVQQEKLIEKIGANVSAERSPFMRLAPLALKVIALKTAFRLYGERLVTTSLSNLGVIRLPESIEEHVDRFEFVLGAPVMNMLNCGICSYKNRLVISFTRIMQEADIERYFFRFLADKGLDIIIESYCGVHV